MQAFPFVVFFVTLVVILREFYELASDYLKPADLDRKLAVVK